MNCPHKYFKKNENRKEIYEVCELCGKELVTNREVFKKKNQGKKEHTEYAKEHAADFGHHPKHSVLHNKNDTYEW